MFPLVETELVACLLKVKFEPTEVVALEQLDVGAQLGPGAGGEVPPVGSTDA